MSGLNSKVTIITGAGSGIGRATAIHFASLGCYLSLNDLNPSTLLETLSLCQQSGLNPDKGLLIPGDITIEETCRKLVSSTIEHFGKLDIVVNNAGIYIPATMDNNDVSDLEKMLKVNFVAAFNLLNAAMPHLKESRGCVVNVSSMVGSRPFPGCLFYGSTKAALTSLTKNAARDVFNYGVRVNAVCPGFVKTNLSSNAVNSKGQRQLAVVRDGGYGDMGRSADPLEIAKPIAFLCSDDASFVTGSVLYVDNGASLRV